MIQFKLKINFCFLPLFLQNFSCVRRVLIEILGIFTKYLGFLVKILGHKENTFLTSKSWNKLLFYNNLGSSVWFDFLFIFFSYIEIVVSVLKWYYE